MIASVNKKTKKTANIDAKAVRMYIHAPVRKNAVMAMVFFFSLTSRLSC